MSSCCGQREKLADLKAEQKWDYINLDEFKSKGCGTPLSYGVLYISLIISISVYAVDTFTAVNLLAFDRWSGQIKPAIPLKISRWIFAGCIIASFVLLFYRWLRAIRVMKQGGVAQSYLDPLAVRIQSIRMGKNGRGWRRFVVFAELTKSRKGADYVALLAYFSFEAWLRVVFAEGPRQVVNAITLYSVLQSKIIPTGKHAPTDGHTEVEQFFVNIQDLANTNTEQAVILFGMLFTLLIWVISVLNLLFAVLLYVFFLFHHIPSADGGLSSYCRRKINGRMEKVVRKKVVKALQKENAMRGKQPGADSKDGKRQPTLPSIGIDGEEKQPQLPILSRVGTEASTTYGDSASDLNLTMSRQPTLPDFSGRPGAPTRTVTDASAASNASYASNAPLMGEAGGMGYGGRSESPSPDGWRSESPRPASPASFGGRPMPPGRSLTGSTQSTQRPYPGSRPPTAQGRQTPGNYPMGPPRNGSQSSLGYQQGPNSYQMGPIPRPGTAQSMAQGPPRPGTAQSMGQGPFPRPGTAQSMGGPPSVGRRTPGPGPGPMDGRSTSSFSNNPYMNSRTPPPPSGRATPGSQPPPSNGYAPGPFNAPMRSNTPQGGPQGMPRAPPGPYGPPPRSMTQPMGGRNDSYSSSRSGYPPRSGTAPPPQGGHAPGGYGDILDEY